MIDIAKEASELGFDEIQYDYVRFPETTNFKYDMSYLEREKSEYINDFMQESIDQLPGVIFRRISSAAYACRAKMPVE